MATVVLFGLADARLYNGPAVVGAGSEKLLHEVPVEPAVRAFFDWNNGTRAIVLNKPVEIVDVKTFVANQRADSADDGA